MKKTILVTGGAGYVGSPLVNSLLNRNYKVLVLDKLYFGGESLLSVWCHPDFKLIEGCVTSTKTLTEVFNHNEIYAVVHLAAIVGDPACAREPQLAKKINLEGSMKLLEFSIKNKVQRFIFASTCSNYGKMDESNGYVNETSPLNPVSLYAKLKIEFEKTLLNELKNKNGFCPTCLRFATVYGVSPRMRFDLTVNEFTKELALGRELLVFGEQFWRPYCHVSDFSRAILLVLESEKDKVAHNVFNVGETDENYQKGMIIDEILQFIPDAKIKYVRKDEDPRDYRVSFGRIKNLLGFKITKKIPDGILEIKNLVESGVLLNPDDPKFKNI